MVGWCHGIRESFSFWERQAELLVQQLRLHSVLSFVGWYNYLSLSNSRKSGPQGSVWTASLTKRIAPSPGCSGNQNLP